MWAPHTARNIYQIERVQWLGVKIVTGEWRAGYHDSLLYLSIPTLERRRMELSLCLLYKIINSFCYFPDGRIIRKDTSAHNTRASAHLLLEQPFGRTNAYHNSFIPHSISIWNFLPADITLSSTLKHFYLSYL